MVRTARRSILMVVLILGMVLFQMGSAQARLTEEQRALMERGRTEELAKSLTRGADTWAEEVARLYLFVRDEIEVFRFEERRSPRRVLRDGAAREEDKARLLSVLLGEVGVRGYLATINYIRFGEDQIYSFVALRATREEAEALSRATGGAGKFIHFPLRRREGRFIPLVPLSGYSIGQLSPRFYEEVNGEWKEWKYRARLARF